MTDTLDESRERYAITIVTDSDSWFIEHLDELVTHWRGRLHTVAVVHDADDIPQGDIAFLLSFSEVVDRSVRERNRHNIVVHASALPHGKGWSPVSWQILEGKNEIPLTLFEAVDRVDAGDVYLTGSIELDGTELVDEIRAKQARAVIDLCKEFIDDYPRVLESRTPQSREGESFYPRRGPEDSRLDPDATIREQFDLLRIADPERYPTFVEIAGRTFIIKIEHAERSRVARRRRRT